MTLHWQNLWTFKTAHFAVTFDCTDDNDLDLSFDDDGSTREGLNNGTLVAFGCRVAVWYDGDMVGSDSLWGCIYRDARQFYTAHRDADPMNRNCTAMRAAHGRNDVVICHYFPDMVRQAVRDARNTMTAPRPYIRVRP